MFTLFILFLQIFRLDYYNLPPDFDDTRYIKIADFDGDGFLDILSFNLNNPLRMYKNTGSDIDGDGYINFEDVSSFVFPGDSTGFQGGIVFDFNGDNFPDIFGGRGGEYGNSPLKNLLWINTGNGNFFDATSNIPADTYYTREISIVDIDGDGLKDMVLANGRVAVKDTYAWNVRRKQINTIFWNRGDTDNNGVYNFIDVQNYPSLRSHLWNKLDLTQSVCVADVNGDSLPDIFFANYDEKNELYLNIGIPPGDSFPEFVPSIDSLIPEDAIRNDFSRVARFGDLNNDGFPDLIIGVDYNSPRMYINIGNGKFSDSSSLFPSDISQKTLYIWDIILYDFNEDNFLDILFAGEQNVLLINDSLKPLHFKDLTDSLLPKGIFTTVSADVEDLDKDGYPEIILGDYYEQNRFQKQEAGGIFKDITTTITPGDGDLTYDVGFFKYNNDSLPDIFVVNSNSPNKIYVNRGNGIFRDSTPTVFENLIDDFKKYGVCDIEGDGDMDFIVSASNKIYFILNEGNGNFSIDTFLGTPSNRIITDMIIYDFTGDSLPDIYVSLLNYVPPFLFPEKNLIFINQGGGNFTDETFWRLPNIWDISVDVELGDFNNDGNLDIYVGNIGKDRLLLNEGGGYFTDKTDSLMPFISEDTTICVSLGDLNADGNIDIFIGNKRGEINKIYLNHGIFYDSTLWKIIPPLYDTIFNTRDAEFFDFDRDGDKDLVVVNWTGKEWVPQEVARHNRVYLYLNQNGVLKIDTEKKYFPMISYTGENLTSLGIADVNNDGYLDVYTGVDGQNRLYINHIGEEIKESSKIKKRNEILIYYTPGGNILLAFGKDFKNRNLIVRFYDVTGRKVYEFLLLDSKNKIVIPSSKLKKGTYFLSFLNQKGKIVVLK